MTYCETMVIKGLHQIKQPRIKNKRPDVNGLSVFL